MKPSAAFTLIEVTLALAIFGMGLVVLTQSFVNGLISLEKVDLQGDTSGDIRFVRGQIITLADLEELEDGGDIPTLSLGRATWEATAEPTPVVDLFKVELRIRFDGNPPGIEPFEHRETLYLLRPTWSDPIDRSVLISEAREALESERLTRDWF
jgi:prepilin-type N-terminal cleavage/methylation domain-containing protein